MRAAGLALCMAWIGSAVPALAADPQVARLGIFEFEPWGMERDGDAAGIVWDQARELFAGSGVKLEPVVLPYPRMQEFLREGKLDVGLFIRYEQNGDYLDFVSPLHELKVVVISPRGSAFAKYADFAGKSVGFPLGGSGFFSKLYADAQIRRVELETQRQGVQMIAAGRLDGFVGIDKTIAYEMNKAGLGEKVTFPGFEAATLEVWLQISKKSKLSAAQRAALEARCAELRKQGAFDRIVDAWISQKAAASE